jgi:hypothetical protein
MASEFFHQSTLIENRGRREDRVPFAPMVRVQQKSTRQNHRYEPNNRPSLRNGFNGLLRALPGETGLCCHRRFASSRKTRHLHRGARTTRLRRPPHAVRLTTRRGHRIPLPTSVTIAKRPSCGSETSGSIVVICPTTQEEMCTTGSLCMAGMRIARLSPRHCERSEAIQTSTTEIVWIASSLSLLAMTTPLFAVIPGRAVRRGPGIHTHDGGYGFRARAHARPGMTAERIRRVGKGAQATCPPFRPCMQRDGGHGALRLCPPYRFSLSWRRDHRRSRARTLSALTSSPLNERVIWPFSMM